MESTHQAGPSHDQVEYSDSSESNSSKFVVQVRKLIHRRMLVGIKDGRFFLGTFYCIDKQGNIILQDAVEYRSTRRSSPSQWNIGLLVSSLFLSIVKPPVTQIAQLKSSYPFYHLRSNGTSLLQIAGFVKLMLM